MPKVEINVPWSVVDTMLSSAFSGGSLYWCYVTRYESPSLPEHIAAAHYAYQCALYLGGSFTVGLRDNDLGRTFRIDASILQYGLQLMAEQYPCQLAAAISKNGDAITGDIFLQLCCFEKVLY